MSKKTGTQFMSICLTTSRNLIVCPIGDRSVHRSWIAGPEAPRFDLLLVYYGNGPDTAASDARYYFRRKGFKFEHLKFLVEQHSEILSQYERIWCPDDDVQADASQLNLLFDIFERYGLQLAQPAVARGQFSYKALLQRRGNILRYTPFVETMCPLFTREAFFKVADTFGENRSGWGIDWLWSRRFQPSDVAVIDKVGVHHTGQLGKGEHYQKLAPLGIDPSRDFRRIIDQYGLDWVVHNRMLCGRQVMRSIRDPDDRRSVVERAVDYLRWRRCRRSVVA